MKVKPVKIFFRITAIMVVTLISIYSCRTNQTTMESEAPFAVLNATWHQQMPSAHPHEGIRLDFSLSKKDSLYIVDSVYFRGNSSKLQKVSVDPLVFSAFFPKEKHDRILDSDPVMESQNRIPRLDSSFPFDLQPDEAVIRYQGNNKKINFKLVNLKEKPLQTASDSIPQNN